MLFCDLVGSTAFSTTFDPEELISIMRRFQSTCDAVITGHGGTVAKFMGDGILAYLGTRKPMRMMLNAPCARDSMLSRKSVSFFSLPMSHCKCASA